MAGAAPTLELRIRPGGRQRGRYVLGELLGRGGMAEVFAGHALGSHGFQKPVAIKRLLPELADDVAFVDRLIEEAKLLVGMSHGNVVSVLDLVRESDDVFLVMEYVDGPSLRQLVQTRFQRKLGPLPFGVATYVAHAAATGLEFAHARPGGAIIHADISPSNLLLTTSGEVKVADFGIARREGVGLPGIVEGKWAYMAPEQARGEPLTPRADVFALGVVLYELVTGVHPFARHSRKDLREAAAPIAVAPPRSVRPEIPVALEALCMRAMAYEPRERPPSMQHLVDALVEQRFANGWREGAAELAHAIREVRAGRAVPAQHTQRTDRPVTVITCSLLSESEPILQGTPPPGVTSPLRTGKSRPDGTPPPFPGSNSRDLAQGTDRAAVAIAPTEAAPTPTPLPFGIELPATRRAGVPPRWVVPLFVLVGAFGVIAGITFWMLATGPAVTPKPAPAPPKPIVQPIETLPDPDPAPPPVPAPVPAPVPVPVPVQEAQPIEVAPPPAAVKAAPTRRMSRSKAAPKATPPAAKAAATPPVAPAGGEGTLQVFAEPWAYVRVDGRDEVETPARIKLKAGTYTVKLHNPETGARKTQTVTIRAGKPVTLKVRMDGGT